MGTPGGDVTLSPAVFAVSCTYLEVTLGGAIPILQEDGGRWLWWKCLRGAVQGILAPTAR